MNAPQQETTLANEQLHWGIFIPVILVAFALLLPILPMLVFLKFSASMMSQLSQQPAHSNSWVLLIYLIPVLLIFSLLLLVVWIAYVKSEITLTNKRLVFRTGLLSRVSGELPLENVESIFIIEPFIGRLCGYGTITVTSIGGRAFALRYISSPQIFHTTLQEAVANAKAPSRVVKKPCFSKTTIEIIGVFEKKVSQKSFFNTLLASPPPSQSRPCKMMDRGICQNNNERGG